MQMKLRANWKNVGTKFLLSIGTLRYPPDEPIHEKCKCSTKRLMYILVFDLKWPLEAYAFMPLNDNRCILFYIYLSEMIRVYLFIDVGPS